VLVGNGNDFLAVRLRSNGVKDPSFGSGGVSRVDFFGYSDIAQAVVMQQDGKIVLAGYAGRLNASPAIGLTRLNSDGSLDAAFGDAGKVALDIEGNVQVVSALVQQPDGRLVIGGGIWKSDIGTRPFLVRLEADGDVDPTFGDAGRLIFDMPGYAESWLNSIALQSDGSVVAAGYARGAKDSDVTVVRVTPGGELDPTFGQGGVRVIDIAGGDESGLSVLVQADARIVISGYTLPQGNTNTQPILVRLGSDGENDASFGDLGISAVNLGGHSELNAWLVEPDGKLVAAGSLTTETAGPDMIAARFNSNGSLDTSFARQGIEIVDFGRGADATISEGDGLARQSDGKYVLVGANSMGAFSAVRIDDSAGSPGFLGLTRSELIVDESASAATYTVRRTGGAVGAVSVEYATNAESAEAGKDFDAVAGTLSWADGDYSDRAVSVVILDDNDPESNETYRLTLSSPDGGAQLATIESSTQISSLDGPGTVGFRYALDVYQVVEGDRKIEIPVTRFGGAEGAVSVSYSTSGGTATSGTDFLPSDGTLRWADGEIGLKTIAVQILQDSIVEGREKFQVCLRDPTGGATIPIYGGFQVVVINDDDGENTNELSGGGCTFSSGSGGGTDNGDGAGNNREGGGGGSTAWTLAWLLALLAGCRLSRPVSRGTARSF